MTNPSIDSKNQTPVKKKRARREYAEALLTALLIALFLRSFVVEAFQIPSGSMIPTLLVGDHIFVNKFVYGVRVPFTKKWITRFQEPKRGEVVVFIYPQKKSQDYLNQGVWDKVRSSVFDGSPNYIKRVVGVGGDQVSFRQGELFVNEEKAVSYPLVPAQSALNSESAISFKPPSGVEVPQKLLKLPFVSDWRDYYYFVEVLNGVEHWIQRRSLGNYESWEFLVPQDHLFVMGDNRDNSSDSRVWGFVPVENVIGRAMFVWLSPDIRELPPEHGVIGTVKNFGLKFFDFFTRIRWNRFGKWIQ